MEAALSLAGETAVNVTAAISVVEIRSLAEIDRGAWDDLISSSPDGTVFQSLEWLTAWWECFGAQCEPVVFAAYSNKRLVGAAPLFIRRGPGQPALRCIGEDHADFLTFPSAGGDEHVVEQLLAHIERCYGAKYDLHLADVPDSSALGAILRRRRERAPLRFVRTDVTPCPRLKMRDNAAHVEEVLKKKSLKRHTAKLASQGTVEVRHWTERAEILSALEPFFEQHRRRWAVTPFPSLFQSEANRAFYRKLAESRLAEGRIVFTTVKVDGRLVAAHFGLFSCGSFVWYKPSFEVTMRQLSPGEVLLRELLLFARDQGSDYFDFTRGDEAFKARFSSETRYNSSYVRHARRLHMWTEFAQTRAKRVAARVLHEESAVGTVLRSIRAAGRRARVAGASLPKAALSALWRGTEEARGWLFSTHTLGLYSAAGSLQAGSSHQAREVDLDFLLDPDRLMELQAADEQFLSTAHGRLAKGDRCFVIEDGGQVAAAAWITARSPIAVTEAHATLQFDSNCVVLYDVYAVPRFRGKGHASELLTGIRAALGDSCALIYAERANRASVRAIVRAGFVRQADVTSRILLGRQNVRVSARETDTPLWSIEGYYNASPSNVREVPAAEA